MNIDTLNAHCGPWLVYCPCLAQGRLNIHLPLLAALGSSSPKGGVAFRCFTQNLPLATADSWESHSWVGSAFWHLLRALPLDLQGGSEPFTNFDLRVGKTTRRI